MGRGARRALVASRSPSQKATRGRPRSDEPRSTGAASANGTGAPQRWIAVGLFVFGLAIRLPALDSPDSVVFDEVHFGRFATAYCCAHQRFFDIHPPHGKLLVAAAGWLAGYRGGEDFSRIGAPYGVTRGWLLRLAPMLAGAAGPAILFLLARSLGASPAAATLAGAALALDTGWWVQTRVIALDGILVTALLSALWLEIEALSAPNAARRRFGLVLAGVAAAVAVGTKITAAVVFPLLAVALISSALREPHGSRWRSIVEASVWLIGASVATYLAGWWIHFRLLTLAGPGDAFVRPSGLFWRDLVEGHRAMLARNYGLVARHPYESRWWGWPFGWRPVFFWSGPRAVVYLIGNPIVWTGGSALALVSMMGAVRRLWSRHPCSPGIATFHAGARLLPPAGFALSILPLAFVPRVLFLYHYFPALSFAILEAALWLDRVRWIRAPGSIRTQARAYGLTILAIAGMSLALLPLVAGFAWDARWLSDLTRWLGAQRAGSSAVPH